MKWVMNIAVIAVIVLGIWLYQTHQKIEEQRVEFETELSLELWTVIMFGGGF